MPVDFQPLLIILGLAFAVPLVAARLTRGLVPIAAAEIIAGMAFGESGLGLIETNEWIDFLSQFGFALLMFLSGLEVDFHRISEIGDWSRWRPASLLDNPVATGLVLMIGSLFIAVIAAWLLLPDDPATHVAFFALVLSTTSVGIVVPVLRERRLTQRPLGQAILMSATIADFLTVLALTVLAAIIGGHLEPRILLIGGLAVPFAAVVVVGGRLRLVRAVRHAASELAHRTAQLGIRAALVLLVLFVALAEMVEAEFVLGAFLAGAAVAFLDREEGSSLRMKLDAIGYGFFVPIFFITVGAGFQISALGRGNGMGLPAILLLLAFAIKLGPAMLLKFRYSWRETVGAGMLLSARLSLIIAASLIGLELGIINTETNAAIVGVAIVTSIVAPAIGSRMFAVPPREAGAYIIVGAGDTGRLLARRLEAARRSVTLVEMDPVVAERARREGLRVHEGSAFTEQVLRDAGAPDADGLIAVTHRDETNLQVCLLARDRFDISNVLAEVDDPALAREFARNGIQAIGTPTAVAVALDNLIERPDLFEMLSDTGGDNAIVQVRVTNPAIAGQAVGSIRLPGDTIVLLIHRDEFSAVPHPDSILEADDILTIAGDRESVEEAAGLLAP